MYFDYDQRSLNAQYMNLLSKTHTRGIVEVNERTKNIVTTLPYQYNINIDMRFMENKILLLNNRRYYPHIAAAETAWQLLGTKDAYLMNKFAPKLWGKFTNQKGEVETAYGYRWQNHFGRNQLLEGIEALIEDNTNRQIVISAWDPKTDGLLNIGNQKNVPCPVMFTLNIIDNKLNMSVFIRSSDIVLGLPYDIMNYMFLYNAIRISLSINDKIENGYINFTLANAHYYKNQKDVVITSLRNINNLNDEAFIYDDFSINYIIENAESFIHNIKEKSKKTQNYLHQYNPKIEVVE